MDAASIEQMNKVRVSLGMAPLPVPGKDSGPQLKKDTAGDANEEEDDISTVDKRQAAAGNNWQRLEAERLEKLDRQKRKDAAKKARDAAQKHAKLEGKGLGEADEDDEMDTRKWLRTQRKRQTKIENARKLEQEMAEREGQQAQYTSKDLAGVKVGHEMDEFDEVTGEQILTLKDAEIGDESGEDELENAELLAKEKLQERLKLKKKKPDYDPHEQDEAKNVLSKYDEEIDGKKQRRFILDGQGNTVDVEKQDRLDVEGEVKSRGVKISLDMLKDDAPISDYVDPATIKVKKPKKGKKEKKTRQKVADEDDVLPPAEPTPNVNVEAEAMEIDGAPSNGISGPSKKRAFEFDDDEDLQAKLADQRRQALKKRKKMDATELARQMREEMPVDEDEAEEDGLVIDETSEFVANLKKSEVSEPRTASKSKLETAMSPEDQDEDEDGDTHMQSYAEVDEEAKLVKRETSTPAPAAADLLTATGLEDEDTLAGTGIGASLAMLRKRGLVADPAGSSSLAAREAQRSKFLADKQHLVDDYDEQAKRQRDLDRRSGKLDRMSNREKDNYARQQNERREAYIASLLADKFNKEYRPDVKLEYYDDYGRSMGQKEAFKHLSHMFHGKGSGKQKTEKRLKKIEDERREMSKGVLNVGEGEGGMANVQGREGRRTKQAGVRLQ